MSKELVKAQEQEMMKVGQAPRGYEEDDADQLIIPRVKLIQSTSPERKSKVADEGDLLNSLTQEKLNGMKFIPVFKYTSNIKWKDRSLGGGIECMAKDGRQGSTADGECTACSACKLYLFDNTRKGKEAQPLCTQYINFFGFFEGTRVPIILSFSKTYFNEGKKLLSMCKFTMKDMWLHKYNITSKLVAKNDNEWYIITTSPAGKTSEEDAEFAESLFESFSPGMLNVELEDSAPVTESSISIDEDMASEI